jgi:hypothetical protein
MSGCKCSGTPVCTAILPDGFPRVSDRLCRMTLGSKRKRTCAFVEMASKEEGNAAIQQFNGHEIGEASLARRSTSRMKIKKLRLLRTTSHGRKRINESLEEPHQ